MTNAEIDLRARAIAVALRERMPVGERALIVCPPGLDYVVSFLACLYAGVIAVPVYPPNPALLKRTLARLVGIITDAQPTVVLAPAFIASMAGQLSEHAPALGALSWQAVDEIDVTLGESWKRPDITGRHIAFLQYTSGSTGQPKGVMVSHANLLENLKVIDYTMIRGVADPHLVCWLPPYHDMGLIGGLLEPAYGAFPVTFMSPLAFLKRPGRWLRAISRYKASIGGGPNFAYDLCIAKTSEAEREGLDLSTWQVAFSGAEPVRADTIDQFVKTFGPHGFRRRTFFPCYGLAEGTLIVSGGNRESEPLSRTLKTDALARDRVVDAATGEDSRILVGCGPAVPGHAVVIADPVTCTRLPEGRVGEIWVSGPSVTHGYWGRREQSAEVFGARLADTGEGPFLRTGDLGFLDGAELFITGRRKDVIIIAGKNHYPQDIERSAEESDPALRPGCGVAFSVEADGAERLVIVHEVNGVPAAPDAHRIVSSVRATVAQEHGLQVHDVVLIRRGKIPKTSSGKLQRSACRKTYLEGGFDSFAGSGLADGTARVDAVAVPAAEEQGEKQARIERWLCEELAKRVKVRPESVDPTQPMAGYGLRSVDMVGMVGDLELWLGRELPATLVWEYPTIEALARHLACAPADQERSGAEPEAMVGAAGKPAGQDAAPAAVAVQDRARRIAARSPVPDESAPVAIIGVGCRFPGGVDDPGSFWRLLCEGRDAVTEVPADRWKAEDFLDEDPAAPGKTNTRWGGFLEGIDGFDPHFFGISPVEAARMDPQQRLLAEVAWEALEDAGVVAERLAGSPTGVFIGIATNDYGQLQFADLDRIDAYAGTGNAFSIAANRLSYLFDLRGPSMSIDTACSSSLVAVHQACSSLAQGECSLAIAGGVNLILSPALAINFAKAGAMAPDGRCKAFDARANGYVRSEGAGVVILKPLERALADRDPIYGVIRGGAVNQDGRTNGLMAPNLHAQQAVLQAAYARAGVPPEQVHYVEAHGTGTLLGDPIEAKALSAVVAAGRDRQAPCLIGSVKSNLGHLEAAAGIAGLIKATLMVRHRMIPPSLHYHTPNPHIPFEQLSLEVVDSLRPWPEHDGPAMAGVSSFGFGGTNAHLVVQEPPGRPDRARPEPTEDDSTAAAYVMTISARSEEALRDLAARYETHLAQRDGELTAAGVSFATTVRRGHHGHRLACVGGSTEEFRQALAAFGRGEEAAGLSWGHRRVGRRSKVAFVFSGQGPRWWPIAGDLLEHEPVFRRTLQRCDRALAGHAGWSLLEQLTGQDTMLSDPAVGQPALAAVQIALAALWRSWGIEPAAVAGHSAGEIAAAHAAGALDLNDALAVAVHRGQVIRSAVGQGRMAVAGVSFEQARQILADLNPGPVWVAASNGPTSTVLSGQDTALRTVVEALDARDIFCRVLESVEFPSHSPLMDPLADRLRQLLTTLAPHPPTIPMISTVTGRPVSGTQLDADYWAANLRRPVLFDQAITALADSHHDTYIEVSPHPMLRDAIAERICLRQTDGAVVTSLRRDEPGQHTIRTELGRLYSAGFPIDWRTIHGPAGPMVDLPSYPWQRQRCWLDDEYGRRRRPPRAGHPILETFVRSAAEPGAYHWSARIDTEGFPYLRDHRVAETTVLPASLLLDAALAASKQVLPDGEAIIEDVRLTKMTVVDEEAEEATLQLVLFPETAGAGSLRIFSRTGGDTAGWSQVAEGRFGTPPGAAQAPGNSAESTADTLAEVRDRCPRQVEPAEHYAALNQAGLQYGPAFQGVEQMWCGEREAVARLRDLTEPTADKDAYLVHPALLDSCLQVLASALGPQGERPTATYLPVAIGRFTLSGHTVPRWAHATVAEADHAQQQITGARVVLFDEAGNRVGSVDGITLQRLGRDTTVADSIFDVRWHEVTADAATVQADADAGWWLLFADRDGLCDGLRPELSARGTSCVTVTAGDHYRRAGHGRYEVDPFRPEDFAALLADLRVARPTPCAGVVHAWSLDAAFAEADGSPLPPDAGCISVLHLVQALAQRNETPRLMLVTRGAQRVGQEADPPAVAQSPLWGLARVITLEHGELRPTIVDLDPARAGDEASRLLDEMLRSGGEQQLALRGGKRYTPRLDPWSAPAETAEAWRKRPFDAARDGNHRILAINPGMLGSLTPTLWERTPPGPGQVEIEVTAAGLNFSDVLKAMEICPGVPPGIVPLGAECAGRLTAVGEGVEGYHVGDVVMAVAPSGMAAFATTPVELVAPKPEGLTDEEAASTPIAFLTAVYGLEYLARLGKGEKVLIHSATGGVGLAALQVARRNGAEIFATAGTEEKRRLLRTLGVEHVMDSRSLRFADEVMEATGGRGVDVVLNSLAGEALTRSLSLLASNGRFVEIGKQDIYNNSHLGLGFLKHNRTFFAVDLERSFAEQPALITHLFGEVVRGFATGDFSALPVTSFPYSEAEAAFAYMAQARHKGKIVLRPERHQVIAVRPGERPVRKTATYLITGGLGALGLETAKYLVHQGARHLVLLGRSRPSAEAALLIDELRSQEVQIKICGADISRSEDVDAVLKQMDASMPPLAGIVHAAGILDDGLLLQLDQQRFRSVAAPKVAGAWHLHRATADRDLDFFVLFSSAAALLGSPSQGNYAAANAFLDSLALYRRSQGLSALSINWGPWAQIGLAARPDRGGALSAQGIVSLSPQDGIEALDRLLRTPTAQACVLPLDRDKLRIAADSGLLPGMLGNLLAPSDTRTADRRAGSGQVRNKLLAVEPGRRRRAMLVQHCATLAARVLKLDVAKVDTTAPLASMGFDSLMSLELRKRLETSLSIELPATVAWRFPTIEALVPFLAERMGIALEAEPGAEIPAADATTDGSDMEEELERLPDSEVEALLLAKMRQIDEGYKQ